VVLLSGSTRTHSRSRALGLTDRASALVHNSGKIIAPPCINMNMNTVYSTAYLCVSENNQLTIWYKKTQIHQKVSTNIPFTSYLMEIRELSHLAF